MPERTNKISIIGAGSVGATIAYACLIRGVAKQIALHDINRQKVDAEVLDLNHGMQFMPMATVVGGDDLALTQNSDIIVFTAGAKQKPGQTRMDLAATNVNICRQTLPKLLQLSPAAILLMVSNPVDVLTYAALKISALHPRRVLGSGTVLDSSRFRFLIAKHLKVAVQNVHAYIAGEHGDSEIPLWSSANVGNLPLHQWAVQGHGQLTPHDRNDIFQNVKHAAYRIIAGKGATNYAVGLAVARILEAILHDEHRVLSVSSLLTDYHGINDVCLSVPCIVNRAGVDAALPIPLDQSERSGLLASADAIRNVLTTLRL